MLYQAALYWWHSRWLSHHSDQFLRLHFSRCLAVSVWSRKTMKSRRLRRTWLTMVRWWPKMVDPSRFTCSRLPHKGEIGRSVRHSFYFRLRNTKLMLCRLLFAANSYESKQLWKLEAGCDLWILHYFLPCYQSDSFVTTDCAAIHSCFVTEVWRLPG
jgi:hypothetical protein